jgi:hypothetical protein
MLVFAYHQRPRNKSINGTVQQANTARAPREAFLFRHGQHFR